jgi:hypothetical protein
MKKSTEYERFNEAMATILKADPKAVKAAMEAEKKERAERRKAKRASAVPASSVRVN